MSLSSEEMVAEIAALRTLMRGLILHTGASEALLKTTEERAGKGQSCIHSADLPDSIPSQRERIRRRAREIVLDLVRDCQEVAAGERAS
jgi:hypothetical protein